MWDKLKMNPLAWLLWTIDFLVWLVYFVLCGWVFAIKNKLAGSPGKAVQLKDGQWRGSWGTEGIPPLVTEPAPGINTGWKCIENACDKFASQKALGTREFIGVWRKEAGHKIVKKIFRGVTWKSYAQFKGDALAFGRGLIKLGMQPSKAQSKAEFEATQDPDTVLLWENTSAEWMTALAGAFSQSIVVATSYATLGMDGVSESVKQCSCRVVICNRTEVAKLAKEKANMPTLETIIYTDLHFGGVEVLGRDSLPKDTEPPVPEPLPREQNGVQCIPFQEVIATGNNDDRPVTEPTPRTMAVVMYTSGSTGKPKGVVIEHGNIASVVGGLGSQFGSWGAVGQETYLAYLPAAHIMELCCEIGMLNFGSQVGFADPRTLSSTGAGRLMPDGSISFAPSLEYAPGAIQTFAPTCMAAVPKIWDILKKGIEQTISAGPAPVRFLFETAFLAVKYNAPYRSCPVLGLIFKKVQAMTGGRLKMGISGGGPISADVHDFIRTVFGMPLLQGYALTETCMAGTVQHPSDFRNGVVGAPLASVELYLNTCKDVLDCKGKPYLSTDTVHHDGSACAGRGEVWIRGPAVSLGYYATGDQRQALLDKTAAEFDGNNGPPGDGVWFHTGDIGMFTPDGSLKLVDRLKNLVKLKGGEYVALEQMEAVFGTSVFVNGVNGGVMVYADGDMDRSAALVQVNLPKLQEWAAANGVTAGDDEQLCADAKCRKAVLDDLNRCGKGKLSVLESLASVHLISGSGSMDFPGSVTSPWTPSNGFLTASNKTDRTAILHGKRMGKPEKVSESFEQIIAGLKAGK